MQLKFRRLKRRHVALNIQCSECCHFLTEGERFTPIDGSLYLCNNCCKILLGLLAIGGAYTPGFRSNVAELVTKAALSAESIVPPRRLAERFHAVRLALQSGKGDRERASRLLRGECECYACRNGSEEFCTSVTTEEMRLRNLFGQDAVRMLWREVAKCDGS